MATPGFTLSNSSPTILMSGGSLGSRVSGCSDHKSGGADQCIHIGHNSVVNESAAGPHAMSRFPFPGPSARRSTGEGLALEDSLSDRRRLRGPALSVGERATNSLALLFHELATNAAKYGALSVDQGTVEIDSDTDEKDIRLRWREAGGPVATSPDKQGYGTRLVNFTMQQLGGKIDYDWLPEGLAARMQLPISSLNG